LLKFRYTLNASVEIRKIKQNIEIKAIKLTLSKKIKTNKQITDSVSRGQINDHLSVRLS